jgi:hypothetical protein
MYTSYGEASCKPGAHAAKISSAKSVTASAFGWNATNAMACLQAALDSGAKKIVVDRQASEWLVETINVPSDIELIFENGVVVRAKPGSMKGKTDCLFRCKGVSNIVFRGIGNATLRMNRKDYLNPSLYRHAEWRHLISLHKVNNAVVRDLLIEESGGDGVYILQSHNVLLENLVCRGHNRQGTSLIDGDNVVRLSVRSCRNKLSCKRQTHTRKSSVAGGV